MVCGCVWGIPTAFEDESTCVFRPKSAMKWLWALPQVFAWSWESLQLPGAPSQRQGHASVEVGRKLYVLFGCHQELRCFNDVHVFDTGSQRWSEELVEGERPAERGGHSATLLGSDIYVVGGANSEAILLLEARVG